MKPARAAALLSIVFAPALSTAKSCNGEEVECVTYFHGSDCQEANTIADYVPTCDRNCFQFSSFDSIRVAGNAIFGTDCHAYSDPNCQNEIGDSGNTVSGFPGRCLNVQGAQSMICDFDC